MVCWSEKIVPAVIIVASLAFAALWLGKADAGLYLNSAHGNSTSGVYRTSMGPSGPGFAIGNCAHCHEQHASVGGSEPDPTGGSPSNFSLFYTNYVNQTDGMCVKCHTDIGSLQSGGSILNYSYSYRAGGWTGDLLNDVLESFSFTTPGTSHNLSDIRSFLTTNVIASGWGYTTDSNPCVACHNPHAARSDLPVSLPSLHSKDNDVWGLWGDTGETMNDYALVNYQAPYRYNSTTLYEPDGSLTTDGSNLTDFVTFCIDCHQATDISSATLGTLKGIDWETGEKHGKVNFDGTKSMDPPYDAGGTVLACTDCHEPHGSPNQGLIRPEVNGNVLGITIDTIRSTDSCLLPTPSGPFFDANKTVASLCNRCHKDDNELNGSCGTDKYFIIHHDSGLSGDAPYDPPGTCDTCHTPGGSGTDCNSTWAPINCNCCHFHGSEVNAGSLRKTF